MRGQNSAWGRATCRRRGRKRAEGCGRFSVLTAVKCIVVKCYELQHRAMLRCGPADLAVSLVRRQRVNILLDIGDYEEVFGQAGGE